MSPAELWQILTGAGQESSAAGVFWQIRLPRVILTMCSGAALALSGWFTRGFFEILWHRRMCWESAAAVSGSNAVDFVFWGLGAYGGDSSLCGGTRCGGSGLALAALMKGGRVFGMVIAGIVVGALCNSLMMTLKYTRIQTGICQSLNIG